MRIAEILLVVCILLLVSLCYPLAAQWIHSADLCDDPAPDQGTLTADEYRALQDILAAVENGDDRISFEGTISQSRMLTHLGLHYGSMENLTGTAHISNGEIVLDLERIHQLEQNKVVIDARVDEALMHIHEGSDRYKLRQIARYIAGRITYTDGVSDTLAGLNGQGVCSTYSMLFYKMASRLGIQCYICYGYAGGEYHAWNMVVLDGKQYFYDITWFDTLPLPWYLHDPTNWGRSCVLNDLWEGAQI